MSDLELLADPMLPKNEIQYRTVHNNTCLCCGKVEEIMVRIGAFTLCVDHHQEFFGVDKFSTESELYNKYKELRKKYSEIC